MTSSDFPNATGRSRAVSNREMPTLVETKDWSTTPLGPRSEWPAALKQAIEIVMAQPLPAILLWGPELIQMYNDEYRIIVGQKHPAALGQPVLECWPEARESVLPIYERVLRGESVFLEDRPLILNRANGPTEAFVTAAYSPVRDDNEKIQGILVLIFETTEKVATSRKNLELADQRRIAFEAAHLGWWSIDLKTMNVFGDKRLQEICGLTEDIIGFSQMMSIIHPNDRMKVDHTIRAALLPSGDQMSLSLEYRVVMPNSSLRWVLSKGHAIFEGEGTQLHPVRIIGTIADITDAKIAESNLISTAEHLRLSLEASNLGDWEWTVQSDIMKLSSRAADIFGVQNDTPITRTQLREFILEEFRESAEKALAEANSEFRVYEQEYQIRRPDGVVAWLSAKGRAIYDFNGNIVRMLGVVQDVTPRKNAEAEREQLLESERAARVEAERVNRMKDEFLATLSHELRTPLNAIVGWSQILRKTHGQSKELSEGLETIERNGRSQSQIIDDLLDMNRIMSGKIRLEMQRVDLGLIVQASVETMRPAANAKEVTVICDLDSDLGPIMGDPNRLQQIFWNLLSNAVKFTLRGGAIHIGTSRTEAEVSVVVEDNGIGINPEFLPFVFDRFRQADASTTRKHGGLGLGLSIAKQLMELQGGNIAVHSEGTNKGSRFTVTLPVAKISSEVGPYIAGKQFGGISRSESVDEIRLQLRGVRALVVDDERDTRELIKRLLEDCQARVDTVGSAAEAMDLIGTEHFDILISDIGMPLEDGYQLIQRVRKLGRENGGAVPALALTAYARSEDRIRAIRAGFHMHVVKPVEPSELITMVASLVGAARLQ